MHSARATMFKSFVVGCLIALAAQGPLWGSGFSGGGGGVGSLGSGAAGALIVGTGSAYAGTIHGDLKAQSITFPTNSAAACDLTWQDTGVVPNLVYPTSANLKIKNSDSTTSLLFRNGSSGIYMDNGSTLSVGQDATFNFYGRSHIQSPSDGILKFHNNASSAFDRIELYDTTYIAKGSGSPEGVYTAPVSSLYLRTNGGTGTTLYIKESGSGNTGWVAVASGGSFNPAAATDITFASGNGTITGTSNTPVTIQNGNVSNGYVIVYGGSGCTGGISAGTVYLQGGNATGTNIGIGKTQILGGRPTGTGTGGSISMLTHIGNQSSGTSANTVKERFVIYPGKTTLTNTSATAIFTGTVADGSIAGVHVVYVVKATDGTDFQSYSGSFNAAIVNKAGTITASTGVPTAGDCLAVSAASTLTVSPTVTSSGTTFTVNLTATSSLTSPTVTVAFQVQSDGLQSIAGY